MSNIDYEEWQAQEDALTDYYEIFRDSFVTELADSPQSAVRKRHHEIILDFRTELDFAKTAFEDAERARGTTGTGWMSLLLAAYFSAYRAVEWYQSELGTAIAEAMAKPFSQYLKPGTRITAREFFRPKVMGAFRNAVLDKTFEPLKLSKQLKEFRKEHSDGRNDIAHSIDRPTPAQTKSCVSDAIKLYNLLAKQLNRTNPVLLENV